MKDYHCPACGRWLVASDAPPGHKIQVPPCRRCADRDKRAVILKTEREYPSHRPVVARVTGTC